MSLNDISPYIIIFMTIVYVRLFIFCVGWCFVQVVLFIEELSEEGKEKWRELLS